MHDIILLSKVTSYDKNEYKVIPQTLVPYTITSFVDLKNIELSLPNKFKDCQ